MGKATGVPPLGLATATVSAMVLQRTFHCYREFTRYAFAVQYHGQQYLGFSYQGKRGENCIVYQPPKSKGFVVQSDLRGLESVEGRIRRALDKLVGTGNYQNIQVSSRTDRGVHAWRNTFQVDIRPRLRRSNQLGDDASKQSVRPPWNPTKLVHGINYYLARLPSYQVDKDETHTEIDIEEDEPSQHSSTKQSSSTPIHNLPTHTNIRILSSVVAPTERTLNPFYDPNRRMHAGNPKSLQWDVRFTATRRVYAYRILHSYDDTRDIDSNTHDEFQQTSASYHGHPFEHDRVWRLHEKSTNSLDIDSMNEAGKYLIGTHDFTSFRGKGCQRSSPIVTLEDVCVGSERYHDAGILSGIRSQDTPDTLRLVTVVVTGKSFLYHQVRNIVACLVEVGRGKLQPEDLKKILDKKDRSSAPGMAPAQGLFLVDVEHGSLRF